MYSVFKRLGTELVLGLFLNVRAEEQPELYQEIVHLCTQHWHGSAHTHCTSTVALQKRPCVYAIQGEVI